MTNIDILFTCPHDGSKKGSSATPPIVRRNLDNFDDKICKVADGQGFSIENDLSTKEVTEKIVENVKLITTKSPYTQIAKYRRQYIDYNRKEQCAFVNSGSVQDEYLKYHNVIKEKIGIMLSNNNSRLAFLFDIHGTGRRTMPGSDGQSHEIEVIVGTQQGDTIKALDQEDPFAWWGNNGLIPLLLTKGIKVWPPNSSEEEDSTLLDGGYTIQEYSKIDRLVAIQIEVICALRENVYCSPCRDIFAADLAECITNFVRPFVSLQ